MKKKKSSSAKSKIQKVIESKGLYIALASMVLLVGFSIYARKLQLDNRKKDLSFDDAAWQTALQESGVEFKGIVSPPETPEKSSPTSTGEEKPSEVIALSDESEVVVEASSVALPQSNPEEMQMPCNGVIIEECSVDDLVYCTAMDDWRTHNGIDIAASEGEPVKAASAGKVSAVYTDDMLGIVVTLDHGNGITSLYGNMQNADFISVGTSVEKGDIIGGVGKPGALEADKEPHLHFEVYKNDEVQNPSGYIKT